MIAPVARVGWGVTRRVARRLGVDRAVGRAVDRGVDRALESDAAERATEQVLESEAAKRVWDKVLESEEAQKLVERVAEAPEVRSAITSQGVGLLEDVRRSARKAARRLDDGLERRGPPASAPPAARGAPDLRRRRHPAARDRPRRRDPQRHPAADLDPAGAADLQRLLARGRLATAITIAFGAARLVGRGRPSTWPASGPSPSAPPG